MLAFESTLFEQKKSTFPLRHQNRDLRHCPLTCSMYCCGMPAPQWPLMLLSFPPCPTPCHIPPCGERIRVWDVISAIKGQMGFGRRTQHARARGSCVVRFNGDDFDVQLTCVCFLVVNLLLFSKDYGVHVLKYLFSLLCARDNNHH